MSPASSILNLIGNTPMVELTKFDTGPCRLFMKLEGWNPGGSVKDRTALAMIDAAEKDGRLKPGGAIVEATAGNTGLGLSLVAAIRGYKVILVVPDKFSEMKITHCEGLGAKVIRTRASVPADSPEYYVNMAKRIAAESGAFHTNQFDNPANVRVHETTTGPEIWEQMEHKVDAVVCGVGSGGTLAGLGKFFAKVSPETELILSDPKGALLAAQVNGEKATPHAFRVEGIGQDCAPGNLDLETVDKGYIIDDEESFSTVRELLKREGILAGTPTGTALAGALRYCREQKKSKRVVTFMSDRGDKYLPKIYGDVK
ncbi:MAG: cysteine synthase family protein [Alphaproteobacteria bacterium PRO2]|nr:cysteine synthase family protein [Alphaproteobacteria bacterium PRO2]